MEVCAALASSKIDVSFSLSKNRPLPSQIKIFTEEKDLAFEVILSNNFETPQPHGAESVMLNINNYQYEKNTAVASNHHCRQ